MRFLLVVVLSLILSGPLMAHEDGVEHVHSATDIADVKSNLVVQGTIVLQKKGKKPNSAVVNQQPVWEGQIYTYNPKTRKFFPRTKKDTEEKLPAIVVLKVENGKVTFFYTDKDLPKGKTFSKTIKKHKKVT